jgi:hypothetical protein
VGCGRIVSSGLQNVLHHVPGVAVRHAVLHGVRQSWQHDHSVQVSVQSVAQAYKNVEMLKLLDDVTAVPKHVVQRLQTITAVSP